MERTAKNGFHIQVSLFIAPENVQKFFTAFKPVYDKTIAEPQCISLNVFQSPDDPGHILLSETWDAEFDWFVKKRASRDDLKAYYDTIEPLFVRPREVKLFNHLLEYRMAER